MYQDPYTLLITLDSKKSARGRLYIDDGKTFDYTRGKYLIIEFTLENNKLRANCTGDLNIDNVVEKNLYSWSKLS